MSFLGWSFWIGVAAVAFITIAGQSASGESPWGGGGGNNDRILELSQQSALSHYLKKHPDSVCTARAGGAAGVNCVSADGRSAAFPRVNAEAANRRHDKNVITAREALQRVQNEEQARLRLKKRKTAIASSATEDRQQTASASITSDAPPLAKPVEAGFIAVSYDSYSANNAGAIQPAALDSSAFEEPVPVQAQSKGPYAKPFTTNFAGESFTAVGFMNSAASAK